MRSLTRGLAAGAVGTTVLHAVTALHTARTGRAASTTPAVAALAAADAAGLDLPTRGSGGDAYVALAGIGTGVGVGAVAGLVRGAGLRLPFLAEAVVVGAGAIAATDGPTAVLELTDPSTWAGTDWVRDVVPHLVFGAAVAAALRGLEPARRRTAPLPSRPAQPARPARPARSGAVLTRSLALGVASGARSTLGLVPSALSIGPRASAAAAALVATELVVDKLPITPSRLGGQTAVRVATAATGSVALARHAGTGIIPSVAAAGVGAVLGALAGAAWRQYAADRGWTWQGAAAEDAAALALTTYAWKV